MKRARARELVVELLCNVVGGGWPVDLVRAVFVFGSCARGALDPGDVDIAVDIEWGDPRWARHVAASLAAGRDMYVPLRQALRGRRRSISIMFERDGGGGDIPMRLLWQRGESLDVALGRLDAIVADPSAGRAPRDAMLACFAGLEDRVPRAAREGLIALIDAGVVTVDQVVLEDARVADRWVGERIDSRWTERSPLRRAAHAALVYLQDRGIDPRVTHLHGWDVDEPDTPYFVGFELRYMSLMLHCFEEYGGVEWLEVVHPKRRGPLVALLIRVVDRDALADREPSVAAFFN